ncbi:hypothetical protein HanRHA438_Chr03g0141621 [Helianthus annuus]|nr:hypothetical protein HanRHA438_Chr03g0141621 [Helianthus annuus]
MFIIYVNFKTSHSLTRAGFLYLSEPMLSKKQGAGEAHRPRPEPRRKAQKKAWAFLRKAHIEKKI